MTIDDKHSNSLKLCIAFRRKWLKEAIRLANKAESRLALHIFTEELNDLKTMEASING